MLEEKTPSGISVYFLIEDSELVMHIKRPGGGTIEHKTPLSTQVANLNSPDLLYAIHKIHPILYEDLPCSSLNFAIDEGLLKYPGLNYYVQCLRQIFNNTNDLLQKNSSLKNIGATHDGVWIYTPWILTLEQIKDRVQPQFPEGRCIYSEFTLGYDVHTRTWDLKKNTVMPIDELIKFIIENKIKRIITANSYLPEHYLIHYQYILSLLKLMGVELTMIDFDIHELSSYAQKAGVHCNDMRRFTFLRHTERPWDEVFGLKIAGYIPTAFPRIKSDKPQLLKDDYKLLIIANSRVRELAQVLDLVCSAMEVCRPENLIDDFQLWYYSLRYLNLKATSNNLLLRDRINTRVYDIYINGISLLKYEVIESLRNHPRGLDIYGDNAWDLLYPEFYRHKVISRQEQIELFANRKHLYLLMNNNYAYFECNPVFQIGLEFQTPFLCFPALVKTNPLKPLELVEYRSMTELHQKIDNVNQIYSNPDLSKARQYCLDVMNDAADALCKDILGKDASREFETFHHICDDHERLMEARALDFLQRNPDVARLHFEKLLLKGEPIIRAEESRFKDRSYMPILIGGRTKLEKIRKANATAATQSV